MNAFASECTSGCESGWTVYLEQSFISPATTSHMVDTSIAGGKKQRNNNVVVDDDDQEEDLSMLSDASSGPPHFNEDEIYSNGVGGGRNSNGGGSKRRKERKSRRSEKQEAVDDTASSPAFNLCKSNFGLANNNPVSPESIIDYSQDFSATHFKGRSAYQTHFGYVQPSLSGNQLQNNQWY